MSKSQVEKTYRAQDRKAGCEDCDKRWTGANALAVAHHHVTTFGHAVVVSASFEATFRPCGAGR